MSPRKGEQPTEDHKSARQSHGALWLCVFLSVNPFRGIARPYFFLFQHVCAGRIAGSEDFRLGIRVGKRIEGVFVALFFQLLAPESLFLRRNRRKRISFPDWKLEERTSL